MDSDTVKLVKDDVKRHLGIVNKLTMEKAQNLKKGTLATQHIAAAVEGIASLLMEHVLAPKEPEGPETQLFTVVGIYSESDEIVVDHYQAVNAENAVNQFWFTNAESTAEDRRGGCQIVAVFHGRLYDLLSINPYLGDGPVSFPKWQEAMEEASAKETPK